MCEKARGWAAQRAPLRNFASVRTQRTRQHPNAINNLGQKLRKRLRWLEGAVSLSEASRLRWNRFALHPDVFIPELRTLANEILHQLDAFWIVENRQFHPARTHVGFGALKVDVLSDDDPRDFVE